MKNLFLVINKEKVYAYVVSIMTIATLFFMSIVINGNPNYNSVNSMSNNVNIKNEVNTLY